ncbi:Glycerol-3-phosphate dehydrogenase [Pseudomonas syringae pv. actinidiae]|uniref:Glycerol-3-phosphate dehydrogenase n=1 Tax=Pseudomonas syringae pv. actinidiae TaxID=103796 RepID=A0AAN4Q9A6_PSESF|nr:Glycerol-3-phosphate dehydrogenase [Pseudomonas syringae pv. actinidiae]
MIEAEFAYCASLLVRQEKRFFEYSLGYATNLHLGVNLIPLFGVLIQHLPQGLWSVARAERYIRVLNITPVMVENHLVRGIDIIKSPSDEPCPWNARSLAHHYGR